MRKLGFKTKFLNFLRRIFKIKTLEQVLLYFSLDSYVDSFIARFIPSHYLYKPSNKKVNRRGLFFEVDISDYNDWKIFWGLKEKERECLFNLIKDKENVIDIGTNNGFVILNIAKIISKNNGNVIGFEPDPINYNKAIKNISMNSYTNISLFNLACGAQEEFLPLNTPNVSNRGQNRLTKELTDDLSACMVKVVKLDDFLDKKTTFHVDMIKIDVEGFEQEVLIGAKNILRIYRPCIFLEVSDLLLRNNQSSANDLLSFLSKLGYQIYSAKTGSMLSVVTDYSGLHFDAYCIYSR